jgi:hypothetical protein
MKKIVIPILIISIVIVSFFYYLEINKVHSIKEPLSIEEFDICLTNTPPSTKNPFLTMLPAFIQKFGGPRKRSIEYSEPDEENLTHLIYNGAEVWFSQSGMLQSLTITSPEYSFKIIKGPSIKVGDNISSVKKLFPIAWARRTEAGKVFIELKAMENNQVTFPDINLLFEYDNNSNLITSIAVDLNSS